jgi:hypothetical protein
VVFNDELGVLSSEKMLLCNEDEDAMLRKLDCRRWEVGPPKPSEGRRYVGNGGQVELDMATARSLRVKPRNSRKRG